MFVCFFRILYQDESEHETGIIIYHFIFTNTL